MTDVKKFRRIFAIADIHGDYDGLQRVLKQMYKDGLDHKQDLLVQLGDMVDGFQHAKEVVDHFMELQFYHGDNVVVLLGNHEDFILRAVGKHEAQSDFRAWWYQGGKETWLSYQQPYEPSDFLITHHHSDGTPLKPSGVFVPNPDMQIAIEWFESLPLYYETKDFIFVHAGLREPLPPEAQKRYDILWIREDFHNSTYDWGKTVVYGHTARKEPLIEKRRVGLDCRWRGEGYVSGAELQSGAHPVRKLYRGA